MPHATAVIKSHASCLMPQVATRAAVGLGPEATEAELAASQVRGAVITASTEGTCRHHPISALSPPLTSMSRLGTVPGIRPVHI
jgi:hypothetical protein